MALGIRLEQLREEAAVASAASPPQITAPNLTAHDSPVRRLLRSHAARKALSAVACSAAMGWLLVVSITGIATNASLSQMLADGARTADDIEASSDGAPSHETQSATVDEVSAAGSPVSEIKRAILPFEIARKALREAIVSAPGLRLREQPTTQARVLEVLAEGTALSVAEGGIESDGFQWVPVQAAGELGGWVVTDGLE